MKPIEKHGKHQKREYDIWCGAIQRCENPNNPSYKNYGGRGIKMCPEWRNSFLAFYAYIGPRPPGLSINRVDNDKGYEPGNVVWADQLTQSRNRRKPSTGFGVEHYCAKATPEIVAEIRAHGSRPYALGKRYGLTDGSVWKILNRKSWKSIPPRFPSPKP